MGSVGDCFDNAMCESFFATLECELLNSRHFKTQIEARTAIFEFIEGLCEVHDEDVAKLIAIPEEGRRIEG
jgi:transposase InsO family protein